MHLPTQYKPCKVAEFLFVKNYLHIRQCFDMKFVLMILCRIFPKPNSRIEVFPGELEKFTEMGNSNKFC